MAASRSSECKRQGISGLKCALYNYSGRSSMYTLSNFATTVSAPVCQPSQVPQLSTVLTVWAQVSSRLFFHIQWEVTYWWPHSFLLLLSVCSLVPIAWAVNKKEIWTAPHITDLIFAVSFICSSQIPPRPTHNLSFQLLLQVLETIDSNKPYLNSLLPTELHSWVTSLCLQMLCE